MYPYINLGVEGVETSDVSQIKDLKSALLNQDIGLDEGIYSTYEFNKLTAQEAITAVQAAIWNIEKGKTSAYYAYRGTISSFSSS